MKTLTLAVASIFLAVGATSVLGVDSWALPEKRTVCSKSGRFCLEVIPKKLKSQRSYFEDKVAGKANAGADDRVKKNDCRAIFFARQRSGANKRVWEKNLVNEVSPVSVLVSDQGDYVVTFDNWHSVGYGDDAIAIYNGSDGTLVRKFGLSEFLTDSDINALPTSVSSIWWGGNHWIDSKAGALVLQVTKGKRAFEDRADYFEIRVELESGKILDEKRDRLPTLQFVIDTTEAEVSGVTPTAKVDATECFDGTQSDRVSSSVLRQRATKKVMPGYPPAAKAVRAQGQVAVEILVSRDGYVQCARAVSGHPLLRPVIVAAVKNWTFERADQLYSGYITFELRYTVVTPAEQ